MYCIYTCLLTYGYSLHFMMARKLITLLLTDKTLAVNILTRTKSEVFYIKGSVYFVVKITLGAESERKRQKSENGGKETGFVLVGFGISL